MELASCHHSGAQNFEVAAGFLENACNPDGMNVMTFLILIVRVTTFFLLGY
jgi:hypothetical protein